ncbi:BaiN/RdsA family NAD(P)/FAD-dependent oxidoreductase [Saccharibacter floricola]|uniref:NAD(P)/FAD-dependent oxidoreductase n=1 Tax=Saccharibacter floricola TaxID=231053 RepID=UPI00036A4B5F|nr:aminoacetone oxidase family FAD-binding enzyme [Saccharibacter floricola]
MSAKGTTAWDVLVLGAGAAGLMAAATASQRGVRVAVLDHAAEPGRKILISGGGRCNFTHLETSWERYQSANPRFARSALARYTPRDFLNLVEKHHIAWHEKEAGQLFCDGSARQIVTMLEKECAKGAVRFYYRHALQKLSHDGHCFQVHTSQGIMKARTVVLATGGLALPKLGATDSALQIARHFDLDVVAPMPALVPLTLEKPFPELAGVSLPVTTSLGKKGVRFTDGMVFTHRGLSGPAILQISSYRSAEQSFWINLRPGHDVWEDMTAVMKARPRAHGAALLEGIPIRLARHLAQTMLDGRPLAEQPGKAVRALAEHVARWVVSPAGTEGYAKAEVMRGGVDTRCLSSQTMEAKTVPGLYIVGEAVDMTGWLGGYNFQWAWASAVAAGKAVAERVKG